MNKIGQVQNPMITQAAQDYLKVIYRLEEQASEASTQAISQSLKVTQPSVTGMIKKLAEMNLISYTPYQGAKLTDAGKKIALETIRHHRLLELYLAKAMGYSWDQVHKEAEKLEHFISEEFEDRMDEILGRPKVDPHGAPIPSKEGIIEERQLLALNQAEPGRLAAVKQISDKDPEKLRYLAQLGIFPEVVLKVIKRVPYGGAVEVEIAGSKHLLGEGLAAVIFVSLYDESKD